MTVAGFAVALFGLRSVDVTASAEEHGVSVQRAGKTREHRYEELGRLLRHQDRVWLVRRNGNLLDLAFESVEEAARFEKAVRRRIGARRIELLAGLMDEDPKLAQELLQMSADPRLETGAKAAQGSEEDWQRALKRLENEGALE